MSRDTSAEAVFVNKIIPISTVDGPGARTAVFLQACNLRCAYCHNPETQTLCRHCGICVPGCPTGALNKADGRVHWNESICIDCDQCIAVCPYFSTPKVKQMTPEAVFAEIEPNLPFIRGVTVSGGECTLYPEFLTALFQQVKAAGRTTLVDANGAVDFRHFPDLMAVTDGVMLDLKAWDPVVYEHMTERPRPAFAEDLIRFLAETGKLFELRLVCQKDWIDVENTLRGVAETIPGHYRHTPLKLIAFRTHCVKGRMQDADSPDAEEMQHYRALAQSLGYERITIR